ncbi:hypothetical protein FHR99_001258 [Litorivivens lipolytica]|uniref:Nucleoprotein/polynucleotide-associated enzyme n=1 Tax=Litorivivens lipolytica TaxID=1524264 RepID=A0A7W4W545_9GAMM|nr:DUF2058 domain-containing protein [Litorivivens lipolytica]MBB3047022.1 hypothetical protein [Litorivivens lipolytica]
MASLQEQLLKAGVVDEKKAKQLKKEKRKAAKQPKGHVQVDESKAAAAKARAEKAERDRELNRQRQAEAEKKAIQAQINQLITTNAINRQNGEQAYQFVDGKKIKKLYVTNELQAQLTRGQIAIVKLGEAYELVPSAVAEKIRQRDEARVLVLHDKTTEAVDEDDPYADYQIPDDLMW